MKKIICFVLSLLTILTTSVMLTMADENVSIYVNGKYLDTDQGAIIANGRTLVPLRAICEALKCEVTWYDDTKTAEIQNPVTLIAVQVNNYKISKIDKDDVEAKKEIKLDVPPIIHNNRTLVPARAIAEALYAEVNWDAYQRRVDISLEYDYIGSFGSYSIARVEKDGKHGFINEAREVVIPLIYDGVMSFVNGGLAEVRKDGKCGYIDIRGRIIVPIKYDYLYSFSPEGLAAVKRGNKWGYVDLKGREVIPVIYDDAKPFMGGYATVTRGGRTFKIDVTGKEIN